MFGCITCDDVPDEKIKKFDDNGEKCIFLGVRETSKAYKLFNPLKNVSFLVYMSTYTNDIIET